MTEIPFSAALSAMGENTPGPVEDQLDDPNHQDASSDLPDPVEGNEDEDDMPDVPAEGE